MNQQTAQTPEQQAKVLKIIWFAMLAATLFYLAIGMMQASALPHDGRSVLANMVWLFGAFFVGLGFALPKMLFKDAQTNATQYNQALIVKYAMFESLAILSLVNFISQGVPFVEMAIGIAISFILILMNKPKAVGL